MTFDMEKTHLELPSQATVVRVRRQGHKSLEREEDEFGHFRSLWCVGRRRRSSGSGDGLVVIVYSVRIVSERQQEEKNTNDDDDGGGFGQVGSHEMP